MTLTADLSFTRAITLREQPSAEHLALENLFHESSNPGMLRRLGATLEESLVPSVLKPTNVFQQELARRMRLAQLPVDRHRFPRSSVGMRLKGTSTCASGCFAHRSSSSTCA